MRRCSTRDRAAAGGRELVLVAWLVYRYGDEKTKVIDYKEKRLVVRVSGTKARLKVESLPG